MKLKGHTTIQLTDASTGEVTTYDNDNMVTNALQHFMQPIGIWNSVLNDRTIQSAELWENLLGGLLLFDGAIEEDPENIIAPAGVTMTANGSKDDVNNNEITEYGSYNASESGIQEDGSIKMVWDFTTSQGNGDIACVCLTSRAGGRLGYGNRRSGQRKDVGVDYKMYQLISSIRSSSILGQQNFFNIHLNDNYFMRVNDECMTYNRDDLSKHWSTTGKIVVEKCRWPIYNASIRDKYGVIEVVERINIAVPDVIKSWYDTQYTANDYIVIRGKDFGCILFYKNYGCVSANELFYIMKINPDGTSTVYPIQNCTGIRINAKNCICIDEKRIFIANYDSDPKWYVINIEDPTQVTEVVFPYLVEATFSLNGIIYTRSTVLYNVELDEVYTAQMPFGYNSVVTADDPLSYVESKPTDFYHSICKLPTYLATINNLTEPVKKEANQMMKVIYTLTFEEEGDV